MSFSIRDLMGKKLAKVHRQMGLKTDLIAGPGPSEDADTSTRSHKESSLGDHLRQGETHQKSGPSKEPEIYDHQDFGGSDSATACSEGSDLGVRSVGVDLNQVERKSRVSNIQESLPTDSAVGVQFRKHPNSRVEDALDRLRLASDALSETFDEYVRKHPNTPRLSVDTLLSAFTGSKPSPEGTTFISGETFGAMVEQVLVTRARQKPTVATKVGQQMGCLYPLARLILGVASSAADVAHFPPVNIAVNGLSLMFFAFEQERTRYEDVHRQLHKISYQALRVGEIQKHPEAVIGDLLLEKSIHLMTSIMEFFRASLSYFLRNYFHNVGKTLLGGAQIYADGKAKLNNAIAEYDQALLFQVANVVLLSAGVRQKPSHNETQDSLMEWLQPSIWEVEAQLSTNRELRTPGTLAWLMEVEEFRQWRLAQEPESACLWLTGLPGVGKSIIGAFLVDILRMYHPDACVLWFFCKQGEPMLETVNNIIRTLAAQLASSDRQAYRRLAKLKGDRFVLNADPAFLVRELISKTIPECSRNIFIVIDGLDECAASSTPAGPTVVQSFLSSLLAVNCRLIVSSRPTPDIATILGGVFTRAIGFEDSGRDIALYVAQRLSSSAQLRKGFEILGEDAGACLVARSNGNFLWVSVVLRLLERAKSAKSFKSTLDNLPAEIGALYDKAIDRLADRGQLDLAIVMLQLILFSRRVLSLDELQVAAEFMLGDKILDLPQFIGTECGSFLSIVPSGAAGMFTAQIGHETFRSHVLNADLHGHRLDGPEAHERLAMACLTCLLKESSDAASFRDYSIRYWVEHLTSSKPDSSGLFELVYEFVQGSGIQKWMRAVAHWEGKHRIFLCRAHFLKVHDDVVYWIVSQACPDGGDRPAHLWAKQIHADSIVFSRAWCLHLATIWLGTRWSYLNQSRCLFAATLRFCRIFQVLGPSDSPQPALILATQLSKKDSYTWRDYGGSDWDVASADDIVLIATLGGYDSTSDVHCGNLAIAECRLNLDRGIDTFRRVLDADPENFVYYHCIGELYSSRGQEEEALSFYTKAIALDPKKPPTCISNYCTLLAKRREREGDVQGAIGAFRDALNHGPSDQDWYYWDRIADIYRGQKDYESVKRIFREAMSRHPEGQRYWEEIAAACWATQDWKAECAVWYEAIVDDPPNAHKYRDNLIRRADSYRERQIWDPAMQIFVEAIALDSRSERLYKKARVPCYLAMTKWAEAIQDLEYLCATASDSSPFTMWEELADAYLAAGELDKAIDGYKRDAGKYPDAPIVFHNVGRAFIAGGNYEGAVRDIIRSLRLAQTRRNENPSAQVTESELFGKGEKLHSLGTAYEGLCRKADATEQYEKAVEAYSAAFSLPKDPDCEGTLWRTEGRQYSRFGELLEKVGRVDLAKEQYARAVDIFDKTTYMEDDELEKSEAREATQNSATLMMDSPRLLPEVDEATIQFRRGRGIAQKYRTNWGVDICSQPPRRRPTC